MTRWDAVVLLLALALLPFLYAQLWGPGQPGDTLRVVSGERPSVTHSLHRDQRLDIQGRLGNSTLHVHAGRVRFVSSPCSHKYCVNAGWLSQGGEIMACLPNGVLIEVRGGSRKYDAINF